MSIKLKEINNMKNVTTNFFETITLLKMSEQKTEG